MNFQILLIKSEFITINYLDFDICLYYAKVLNKQIFFKDAVN